MEIKEIQAKQIITRSRLPDAEYVVNPYTGCEFGCLYCYASFMGKFVNKDIDDWGRYVCAKTNAVELFRREIVKLHGTSDIFMSSVTDPYQGVEAKYRLTRGILEVLAETRYRGPVEVQTKSSMVLRDIDVIKLVPNIEVGMTVTTTDDSLGRLLETGATSTSMRISALRTLNESGIRTYAFIGPLLPTFMEKPEMLDRLFASLADAGIRKVYVEHMNLSPYIKGRLFNELKGRPDLLGAYEEADTPERRAQLDGMVNGFIGQYGMELKLGSTIYHETFRRR